MLSPAPCKPGAKKDPNAREPTNEDRRDRRMEIGHGDWSGDDESDNPANETAAAISSCQPMELGSEPNRSGDANDPTYDRADEESGLPCRVPKDRADHCTQSCQGPCDEEQRDGLQMNRPEN